MTTLPVQALHVQGLEKSYDELRVLRGVPIGGISPNSPFETAAPNCTDRMPIRTSHTGDKRAAGTRLSLNGLAGASCVVRRCAREVRPARTELCRQPGPMWALSRGARRGRTRPG